MSYCNFKVGDEVVCVNARPNKGVPIPLVQGAVYTVSRVGIGPDYSPVPAVWLVGVRATNTGQGWIAARFRKVQRRDLTAWLGQTATYDEEQHAPAPSVPAKKRERV